MDQPAASARASSALDDLYREYSPLLRFLATQRFRVPDDEAQGLIQEIFICFLERHATITDMKAWFVGSICHASRYYWRKNGRTDQLPEYYDAGASEDDATMQRIDVQTILNGQTPRCRELLRLRYLDGYSIDELAAHLHTTYAYVKKLLHQCTACARKQYQ